MEILLKATHEEKRKHAKILSAGKISREAMQLLGAFVHSVAAVSIKLLFILSGAPVAHYTSDDRKDQCIACHTRITLSSPPEAMRNPSGDQARVRILALCCL